MLTTANKLTLFRMVSIPLFLIFFYLQPGLEAWNIGKIVATLLFIVSAITDFFDGAYARANREITVVGQFLDPVADKMLVATGFVCLLEFPERTALSAWMVALILCREFIIGALRNIAAARGIVIAAQASGKWKVAAQLTAIITALVFLSFEIILKTFEWTSIAPFFFHRALQILFFLNLLAVLVTLVSGLLYVRDFFPLLLDQEPKKGRPEESPPHAFTPKPLTTKSGAFTGNPLHETA